MLLCGGKWFLMIELNGGGKLKSESKTKTVVVFVVRLNVVSVLQHDMYRMQH